MLPLTVKDTRTASSSYTSSRPVPANDPTNDPQHAFNELWSAALKKFRHVAAVDPVEWQSLVSTMHVCGDAEDICTILDETMSAFQRFRADTSTWGNLRNRYLKPMVEVLLLCNDAIAETAAYFVGLSEPFYALLLIDASASCTWGESDICRLWAVTWRKSHSLFGGRHLLCDVPRLRRESRHIVKRFRPSSRRSMLSLRVFATDSRCRRAWVLHRRLS